MESPYPIIEAVDAFSMKTESKKASEIYTSPHPFNTVKSNTALVSIKTLILNMNTEKNRKMM
jgi:hypothetical protein